MILVPVTASRSGVAARIVVPTRFLGHPAPLVVRCSSAGDPKTTDTGNGEPPIVDMGAYEFQVVSCVWDLNNNGAVGTGDLIVLLGSWGDPYGTADLIELLGNWGLCHQGQKRARRQ